MNEYTKYIKKKLNESIQKLVWNRVDYVHDPKRDFTRNRKISLRTLIELLITMGAGSQNKEILEFFKFDVALPTASALIQHLNKLKPSGLLFVLQ